ncbi:MAG: hypothetical protein ACREJB_07855, partial [Planctomycetaceae bacterium]
MTMHLSKLRWFVAGAIAASVSIWLIVTASERPNASVAAPPTTTILKAVPAAVPDDGKLRIICFGAHPDDCELRAAGVASLWAE